jgi:hypothetical protein
MRASSLTSANSPHVEPALEATQKMSVKSR